MPKETMTTTLNSRPILLKLRPVSKRFGNDQEDTPDDFFLKLWVVAKTPGIELSKKEGKKTFLAIRPQDLRVDERELPLGEGSAVTLFGRRLKFDYDVLNLPDLRVNCILLITHKTNQGEYPGFIQIQGEILSGYAKLSQLNENPNGLKESQSLLEELWPDQQKPLTDIYLGGTNLQIEVQGTEVQGTDELKKRRLQYLRKTSKGRLWELKEEPKQPELESRSGRFVKLFDELEAVGIPSIISIISNADDNQKSGLFYHVIQEQVQEIIRPEFKLQFQDNLTSLTQWTPKTLKIINESATKTNYQFLDYDEVEVLQTTGEPIPEVSESGSDVKILWTKATNQAEKPQASLETAPSLYFAGLEGQSKQPKPYIWQFGTVKRKSSSLQNDELPVWIRYRVGDAPSSARKIGDGWERLDTLTSPFVVDIVGNNVKWTWRFDLPKRKQSLASPLRLRITLTKNQNSKQVTLELIRPAIEATTPSLAIFREELKDPQSVPLAKSVQDQLQSSRFLFANDGETISLENYPGLKVSLENKTLKLNSKRTGEVIAYRPAPEALIDIIPATGGNLVPEQKSNEQVRLPRDPNHGLIPLGIDKFFLTIQKGIVNQEDIVNGISYENDPNVQEQTTIGVMALLPWVEWKGKANKVESMILYHRNLIQEQAEFISSLSDRLNPDGQESSIFLPLADFLKAVRDRFLTASILSSSSLSPPEIGKLLNWLPGATLKEGNTTITPQLEYAISDDRFKLPEVKLTFSNATKLAEKTLKIGLDLDWLTYNLEWTNPNSSSLPINITIKETNDKTNAKAVNSSVSLLFNNNHYYDNLGILRSIPTQMIGSDSWMSEFIEIPGVEGKVRSLSYHSESSLVNDQDIYFACEGLKLIKNSNEEWVIFKKVNTELYSGVYGFYSKTSNNRVTDYWIRIAGIPIFITNIVSLKFTDEQPNTKPTIIKLKGVLPNPTQIAIEAKNSSRVPLLVQEAVNNQAFIEIQIEFKSNSYQITKIEGMILWNFSLNQQQNELAVLPGKLAQLKGDVSLVNQKIQVKVNTSENKLNGFGSIFGQLWHLEETELTLQGASANGGFSFTSTETVDQKPKLTLSTNVNELYSFNLDVNLDTRIADFYDLQAKIRTNSDAAFKAQLTLISLSDAKAKEIPLEAKLIQGPYTCFIGTKTPSEELPTALILWLEQERDVPNKIAAPKLGGILIEESIIPSVQITLNPSIVLNGSLIQMRVTSYGDQNNDPKWEPQELYTGYFQGNLSNSDIIELHIGEQILIKDKDCSAYLRWTRTINGQKQEFQFPLQLKVTDIQKKLSFIITLEVTKTIFYARKVKPSESESSTGLIYPPVSGNTSKKFELREAIPLDPENDGFCILKLNQITFELFNLDRTQIPIDFCLEPETIQDLEKLPIRIPQLIHRNIFGTRLRITQNKIEGADASVNENNRFKQPTKDEYWLLRPIQDTTKAGGDRLVLLDENIMLVNASTNTNLKTENLLLSFREVSADATSNTKIRSVAGLLNISATETNTNILPEERIEDYLLRTGSVGVAIRRTLTSDLQISYTFINSPFYDLRQFSAESLITPTSLALLTQPASSIDPALLTPKEMQRWTLLFTSRYKLIDSSQSDSSTGDLPLRQVGYEKITQDIATIDPNKLEHIQIVESPTYEELESQWFLPEYSTTPTFVEDLPRGSFKPKKIHLTYGLDKPGATFIHKFQPCTVSPSNSPTENKPLQLEPSIDFALREPQQFKTPSGAKIEWANISVTKVSVTKADSSIANYNLGTVELSWYDTLGEIELKELNPLPASLGNSSTLPKKLENILQIIVQLDQDLLEIKNDDLVIPILSNDQPPRIYLITKTNTLQTTYSHNKLDGTTESKLLLPKVILKGLNPKEEYDLLDIFNVSEINKGYYVWTNQSDSWKDATSFAIKLIDPKPPEPTNPVSVSLVEEKQIKKVQPLALSPKVAVVVRFNKTEQNFQQRTILFGDAALPDDLPVGEKGWLIEENKFKFRLKDEEKITVPFPNSILLDNIPMNTLPQNTAFYLVKYLVGGQTLFDVNPK